MLSIRTSLKNYSMTTTKKLLILALLNKLIILEVVLLIDAAFYLLQNKKSFTDAEGIKLLVFKWVERFFGLYAA